MDELEGVGEYDFIKIVNFCRTEKFEKAPPKEDFLGKLKEKWSQERFYKPTIPDDPFLMHQWDTQMKDVSFSQLYFPHFIPIRIAILFRIQ